ncbi:MAG: class I SAM-dependent methyltransferase [Nitrospirae bacterium]|nr:MAG: class I SAM-dependent methyltransferase [Nitrospirota bacterium]
MSECRICGNGRDNKIHTAREMMFGNRDLFDYVECSACGCLQLADVPSDMAKHYPSGYYSLGPVDEKTDSFGKRFLKRKYAAHLLGNANLTGGIYAKMHGVERQLKWFMHSGSGLDSDILEIGCGSGRLLLKLSGSGFKNLTGIDPFIEKDIHYICGVNVFKRSLNEAGGVYDFVMMHHAFEHMQDPLDALKQVNRLLRPDGTALVRIPVVDSYAWEHYGTDWVQLDAPRHIFLHTRRSMGILADRSGLKILDVVCDSTAFQFYGSEQYKNNIPLRDSRSYSVSAGNSIFTKQQIQAFEEKAKKLNSEDRGDQACFYMKKV